MSLLDRGLRQKGISKLGLVISLLALILFSCEEYNELGEDLISDGDTVGVFSVTLPVTGAVLKYDSIYSYSTRILAGQYEDPDFGLVTAEAYSSLYPGSSVGPRDAEGSIYDSLTLTLRVVYLNGESVFTPQDIEIYQLADTMTYLTSDTVDVDSVVFRENLPLNDVKQVYERLLSDTSLILNSTHYRDDSLFVRIRLDDDFGREIHQLAVTDSAGFTNDQKMNRFLKGLAIVPGGNNSAIMGFDTRNSQITLHYHSEKDTSTYPLALSRFYYSHLDFERAGTALEGLPSAEKLFYPPDNKIYFQDGAGIIPFLNFDAFEQFNDTLSQYIVNDAKLYIPVNPYNDFLEPPQTLYVYATDSTGDVILGPTGDVSLDRYGALVGTNDLSGQLPLRASFDTGEERNRYVVDLTLFIDDLKDDRFQLRNLLLYPVPHQRTFVRDEDGRIEIDPKTGLPKVESNYINTSGLNRFTADISNIRLKIYYTTLR